jgi:hypothetical protein
MMAWLSHVTSSLLTSIINLRNWYRFSDSRSIEILVALSGASAAVWAGSLIAFTLNKRYSLKLRSGLDYIAQAFYVPLVFLALPHPLFRLLAGFLGVSYLLFAIALLRLGATPVGQLIRQGKYKVTLTPETPAAAVDQDKMDDATKKIEDEVAFPFGAGPYTLLTAIAYLVVATLAYERVVLTCYVLLLYYGFQLTFPQIVPASSIKREKMPRVSLRSLLRLVFFGPRKPSAAKPIDPPNAPPPSKSGDSPASE